MGDDFARKLLEKQGWKEGSGLGKHGQGIAKPITAQQNKNEEGLGFKKDSFEPWWEDLYNQAAGKVEAKVKKDKRKRSDKSEKRQDRKEKKERRK